MLPRNDLIDLDLTSDPEETERRSNLMDGEGGLAEGRQDGLLRPLQNQGF